MRHFRAIARVFALCVTTAALCLLRAAGLPFVAGSKGAARRWRGFCFRTWARAAARIAGMKVRLHGAPPRGDFFLVANHLSYMDVVALAAQTDCVFVAKSEVARWPVVGRLCRSVNTIFVDRGRRRDIPAALRRVGRALDAGSGVVLFAEGTSTRGSRVEPFKPSLLELAARRRAPVHYASLSYRTPPGEPHAQMSVCWWGDMTFPGHLYRMFQLPWFEVEIAFGEQPIEADDRKVLARRLWSAVNAQFVPVV